MNGSQPSPGNLMCCANCDREGIEAEIRAALTAWRESFPGTDFNVPAGLKLHRLMGKDGQRAGLERAFAIARGCYDYSGGYNGERREAYHHGMQTVQRCIQAAIDGDDTLQLRVVESIGKQAIKAEEGGK